MERFPICRAYTLNMATLSTRGRIWRQSQHKTRVGIAGGWEG